MTTPEQDVLRAFTAALTPAARHHLELSYDAIRYVRAATERLGATELARIVSKGIGWNHPANAGALLLYRLRREAHTDTDDAQEEASR